MGAPRQETVVRLTDNVVDQAITRLGNDGVSLGDDFATRLDQVLGIPVEVIPNSPATTAVNVGPTNYVMPDAVRVAVMDDGNLPALTAGVIDFNAGTISTGANPTFANPLLTAGQFVKALIQYKIDENKLNVSFGTPAGSLAGCGVPVILDGYSPCYIVELSSPSGGSGVYSNISKSALVRIMGGFRSTKGVLREKQDVSGSPKTAFTLTTISIPKNRTRLFVEENGILLDASDDYTIVDDTHVTLAVAAPVNARVTFIVI